MEIPARLENKAVFEKVGYLLGDLTRKLRGRDGKELYERRTGLGRRELTRKGARKLVTT